jgi:Mn2+/Fe2+ NRAMP family transporter
MKKASTASAILGAAFLMATSAVGPGFLTQTTIFTKQLMASFGFVILASVVLDIFAQLNIWRVLTVSGKRGQDVADAVVPGGGIALALLVAAGGLVFNIGNIAGCALGLNVIFSLDVIIGGALSAIFAMFVFVRNDAGRAMDWLVKILGVVMVLLVVYVVSVAPPPFGETAYRTFFPAVIDARTIVTLVGGTVGGYITFAGAHRLIDAGIVGRGNLAEVNRGAVTGIVLTAVIRFLLFFAALGVITLGFTIDDKNAPASVFQAAAGDIGFRFFGIVMWSAAITSVIGAAYTSVSFLRSLSPVVENRRNLVVIAFIAISALMFAGFRFAGISERALLVWAGTINGFILPFGLALVLIASRRRDVVGEYRHPSWLLIAGWAVVAIMTVFSALTLYEAFAK